MDRVHTHTRSVDGLKFVRKCSLAKVLPGSWYKVVFQSLAKQNKIISMEQLVFVCEQHCAKLGEQADAEHDKDKYVVRAHFLDYTYFQVMTCDMFCSC